MSFTMFPKHNEYCTTNSNNNNNFELQHQFNDQCDVPCTNYGEAESYAYRYIQSIDDTSNNNQWIVKHSMEGEVYYPDLAIDATAWKDNTFYSTTSYRSEIPLPYYSRYEYDILHENNTTSSKTYNDSVNHADVIQGAVFMARNCDSMNDRENIVLQLINKTDIFPIYSISSCLNNANPPEGVAEDDNKLDILRQYLFYLAFENQRTDDYITEKLWQPLVAGVVPIYYGAPNVKDHVPNNSIILVDDYLEVRSDNTTSTETWNVTGLNVTALSEYLHTVATNRTLYESYHEWRKHPLPYHFRKRYDFTKVHSTCRTCRWAFARMYGYGWDHEQQSINDVLNIGITKDACIQYDGLLAQPFREEWRLVDEIDNQLFSNNIRIMRTFPDKSNEVNVSSCDLKGVRQTIHIQFDSKTGQHPFQLRRTIIDQDGVIDMFIDKEELVNDRNLSNQSNVTYLLQIKTLLKDFTNFTEIEPGRYRMQDKQSRLSILTWPVSGLNDSSTDKQVNVVQSSESGTVHILISKLPIRLRFITEDVDTFHTDAHMYENFFGLLMAKDFFNPIEPFVFVPS